MRGTMHAPKPEGQRRRRNAPTGGTAVLVRDGVLRGEELPGVWPEAVTRWHETWRRSAQAQAFEDTDWRRLEMLAVVVEQFYRTGDTKLLSEIRLNEERLGATVVDRLRARMTIEDAPAAQVVPLHADAEILARLEQ